MKVIAACEAFLMTFLGSFLGLRGHSEFYSTAGVRARCGLVSRRGHRLLALKTRTNFKSSLTTHVSNSLKQQLISNSTNTIKNNESRSDQRKIDRTFITAVHSMKEYWEYLPVLNALLQVFATISLGALAGALGVLKPHDSFVRASVRFVFYVALPCLVIKGIGIGIDFYSETNIWLYIVAFLILRAISLVLAVSTILFGNFKERRRVKGLGHVAVLWLSLTWISTVIMGVPISSAVFGNPSLGRKYGILAGISSFIFQLPLQLVFLECHSAEEQSRLLQQDRSQEPPSEDSTVITIQATPDPSSERGQKVLHTRSCTEEETPSAEEVRWWSLVHVEQISSADLWLKIAKRILRNPVLWGIFIGFVLSLTTAGKYLRCPSEYCVLGLKWIDMTLSWLGACVSPLSLFAMGLWMYDKGLRELFSIGVVRLSLFMISKLIVVPLIMVGLAKGMGLNDEAGRAAILIASLPISLASFSLGRQYKIGESDLAANVAVGTLLMLPTVLVWNIVLDAFGLYPVAVPAPVIPAI